MGPKSPNLGKWDFFSEIWCVPFMNTFHHTKNYWKRSSHSRDNRFSKSERSDWPRAFRTVNSRNKFFLNLKKFWKFSTINTLRLKPFWAKTNDTIFFKNSKTLILGTFCPKKGQRDFFFKNRALSPIYVYWPLTSCKKSEKTNERILRTLLLIIH